MLLLGFTEIAQISLFIFFLTLLGLFTIQALKKKRNVKIFLVSLSFGTIGSFFAMILETPPFPIPNRALFLSLELGCYAMQIYSFWLFLEYLMDEHINPIKLTIATALISILYLSLYLIVFFKDYLIIPDIEPLTTDVLNNASDPTEDIWFWADLGYNNLGLFTYLVVGAPLFFKMYKITGEKKPIINAISLLIVSVGYILLSIFDYYSYFGDPPDFLGVLADIGNVLPMVGIFIFIITYLTDIDYIYRIPFDVYSVIISTRTGIPLYYADVRSEKRIKIKKELITGFLNAIASLFRGMTETIAELDTISSKDLKIIMETGDKIAVIVIAERVSYFLRNSMKRLSVLFEERFAEPLDENCTDMNKYRETDSLINMAFPYLVLDSDR